MEKIIINNKILDLINESERIISSIPVIDIRTLSEAQELKSFSETIRKTGKMLNDMRMETLKPLQDNVKEINSKINPTINMLDEISKKINNAIYLYQKQENERIECEKRKALIEQARAINSGQFIPAPIKSSEPAKITKTKKVWRVEIVSSIKDVDPEYVVLSLDDKKIDNAVKAGRIKIKGLKIYPEDVPIRG